MLLSSCCSSSAGCVSNHEIAENGALDESNGSGSEADAAAAQGSVASGSTGGVGGSSGTAAVLLYAGIDIEDMNASSKGLGIFGRLSAATDMAPDTSIELHASRDQICATGMVGQVVDGQSSDTWGAKLTLTLNQAGPDAPIEAWDAADHGIVGFAFDIDQLPAGGEIRFGVRAFDDEGHYCKSIEEADYQEIRLTDLLESCWLDGGDPPGSVLEAIEWEIVSNDKASYPFDFCIGRLSVIGGSPE